MNEILISKQYQPKLIDNKIKKKQSKFENDIKKGFFLKKSN